MERLRKSMRTLSAVLWPSFLIGGLLEMGVFSVLDPSELHDLSGVAIDASRQAVYTLGFLAFWAMVGVACALTALLLTAPVESADDSSAT